MGLINSAGQYFEKLIDGFKIGVQAFKLTIKGNLEFQQNGNTAEHIFPNRNGTVALLDDWVNLRPYTCYVAAIVQNNSSDLAVAVRENNLGFTPVWTWDSTGTIKATHTGGFPLAKTVVLLSNHGNPLLALASNNGNDANQIYVSAYDLTLDADTDIIEAFIEIRVYP
jgi:hypothetical protein